ncbi:MAG: bifunctional diaminohydroxyphosphoribosylaminopyrimidine deaminase/5-amino-6-(5-phosphoribosylamino)uracil reductase RibD [Dongiaceae bacterium]
MRAALSLAARGLGRVWPNPAVGCVIVDPAGRVVGRGHTQPGGRPHAETEALRQAGAAARGATAYVTLEPCSHYGKTPPCAEALIAAGIARCVAALGDPDPRVSGRGLDMLRTAGITVDTGLLETEAAELNAGFLKRIRQGQPLVTLKLATTLDGRIATRRGESQWITGASARQRSHLLRAMHDAILIGSGTALADDPSLTCRLPGLGDRSPVRIVLDRRLRLKPESVLVRTARKTPVWLLTTGGHAAARLQPYLDAGVEVIAVPGPGDPAAILSALGARGLTRLLVEGGAQLAAAFLAVDAVDRLVWMRAPGILGGDALAAIADLGLDKLTAMRRFDLRAAQIIDGESLETYRRLA